VNGDLESRCYELERIVTNERAELRRVVARLQVWTV
jgi:hypothetical protein